MHITTRVRSTLAAVELVVRKQNQQDQHPTTQKQPSSCPINVPNYQATFPYIHHNILKPSNSTELQPVAPTWDSTSAPKAQITDFAPPASTARLAKASSALQIVPKAARPQRCTPQTCQKTSQDPNFHKNKRKIFRSLKVVHKKGMGNTLLIISIENSMLYNYTYSIHTFKSSCCKMSGVSTVSTVNLVSSPFPNRTHCH